MPSETFLAYVAGLFDGEGSVGCRVVRGRGSPFLYTKLEISNQHRAVLDMIEREFGGKLSIHHTGKSIVHRWQVTGKNSTAFAKAIIPYSIIKQPQLDTFLWIRATVGSGILLPYEWEHRHALIEKLNVQRREYVTKSGALF